MDKISGIKKVAVIGPECTGKSDLSSFLAEYFHTAWVPEYARGYLSRMTQPYQQADLLKIAHGQLRLEDEWERDANELLICDTNLYVIKIWSEVKYGNCDPEILQSIATRKYDLYLLTNIDIPWQEDPLREHPDMRAELFEMYEKEMRNQPVPYAIVQGLGEARKKSAIDAIRSLLKK